MTNPILKHGIAIVRIVLGDGHELVHGFRLPALRVDEDQLLLHLTVLDRVVETGQIRHRDAAVLAGPEQRLLPHFH